MNYIYIPFFLIYFLIVLFIAFYLPGRVLLGKKSKFSPLPLAALSVIIGIVLWGWQGYIFGYLDVRWMTYLYILVFVFLFYKDKFYKDLLKKPHISLNKIDWIILLLIIAGVFGQTFYYVRAGFMTPEGMLHVMFNPPDHIWHTSMINEMVKRIPPHEPGMYGILKTNYHYWFNLITAELVRIFRLPLFPTQHIGMYIFGSTMFGVMAYALSQLILPSRVLARWILFFFYFGGDLSYIVTFVTRKVFNFETPVLIEHGALFMDNPPRAFSVVIALAALYFLFLYIDKKYKNIFIMSILFGTLVGFKVYTGFALMVGLSFLAVYHLFFKRNITTAVIVVLATILSAIVFFPVNAKSGGIFFLPFERARDFITYEPLGFHDLEMRWRVYLEHNNIPRLLQLGFIMTAIYLFAQYGTKLIGFIPYRKTLQTLGREKLLFMYSAMFVTIFIGTFFSQAAHVSDSFNFFLPSVIFLTILGSLNLTLFLKDKSKIIQILVIAIVIGLTIPRWIHTVNKFITIAYAGNFVGDTNAELEAYSYLRNNTSPDSLILVLNKSSFDKVSAVVSIHSQRRMFLSGQQVIEAHAVTNEARTKIVDRIYESKNPQEVNRLIKQNNIDYILKYGNNLSITIPESKLDAKEVFANEEVGILKVNK